jgi:hypothetical protein
VQGGVAAGLPGSAAAGQGRAGPVGASGWEEAEERENRGRGKHRGDDGLGEGIGSARG